MRILHTADLHLCSPLTANLTGDKIRERKAELFTTFERMVEKAIELGAFAIIIAGDLFDSDKITLRDCKRVAEIIERYPALTYFYVAGNHERTAFTDRIQEKPKNLIIFGEQWEYYAINDVRIIGRSHTEPGMFESLVCEGGKKNIVILHTEPTEKNGTVGIGFDDAQGRGIDYLALGHYHTYRTYRISDGGIAVYPGTPEGRGFDEEGEKGFVLVDVDNKGIHHSFIPFAKRTLHRIEIDITGIKRRIDIEDKISARLSEIPSDDLVRIELVGYIEPADCVDIDLIYARFVNNYYHFEVKNNTRVRVSPENYRFDKSLRGEFIRLLDEAKDLSEEDRGAIALMGMRALNDEPFEMWEDSI